MLKNFRVRTRLMVAFFFLIFATLALATVSWTILQDANRALVNFQAEALPDISRSLELAERTSNLAAAAPYLANAASASTLQSESESLQQRTRLVLELAESIPQLENTAPRLRSLLSQLETTVSTLVQLTNQRLFLREDLLEFEYKVVSLIEAASVPDDFKAREILRMAERLQLGSKISSLIELDGLYARFKFQYTQMDPLYLGANPDWREVLETSGIDPNNLFELRRTQLLLEQQSRFLLSSTRAIADQLSIEVARFVTSVETLASERSRAVSLQLDNGLSRIAMLSILCVLVAAAGILVVSRLSQNLGSITGLMTRLAEGDRTARTPLVNERDEIGELVTAFGVFRNNALEIEKITESLRQQTKLLETVFSSINDGLSVFDERDRLRAWNPQYAAMLKLPIQRLKPGMSLEEVQLLLPEKARHSWSLQGGELDRDQLRLMRQQRVQRFERRFEDGRVVEFRSSPLPEGGFVTLYSDLTERKEIESQLRQAQKMDVLGQLTGGVAHDFNNLLAAVIGNLQLVEMRLDKDAKARPAAERALAAAEKGEQVTQRLLAFSRKQRLEPEVTIVDELIEGVQDLFEYSVGGKIEIQLDLNTPDALILIDPGQLENALLNLAINSASAMSDGGVVTIGTYEASNPAGRNGIVLEVQDTGSGIAPENLSRVFEPFFTTKKVGEGSGLGLSMVYGFVKQSQGEVDIESQLGQGTRVRIWLPMADPLLDDTHSISLDHASEFYKAGEGQRILVVEDDPLVRVMVQDMLQTLGFSPQCASSFVEAMQIVERQSDIDLVFTDINLGERRTGIDLNRAIRRLNPNLPVLLTSGLPEDQLMRQFGMQQDLQMLAKPYSRETLLLSINRALASVGKDISPAPLELAGVSNSEEGVGGTGDESVDEVPDTPPQETKNSRSIDNKESQDAR